ncbi:glycerol kinase GlpK [Thalassotalea euphylliae]|uniref:Glycerol kinase n=1 Tax=Thalassotalea euphylliae TaxID=1655234 RepID=A0A3E0U1U0_9GAMM|nr:glycerol kinase GlpK [Thalassotalea euphylliae]REL30670.1 glycerol kinase [Thalassotalea euphylliae]
MEKYLLSIDQGTTSSRAILFNLQGELVDSIQQEFTQHYPENGWVEHNPDDILSTVISTTKTLLAQTKISPEQVASIGICNQRETTLVWHRETGKPIYNAIVWQDRRTADYCTELVNAGHGELITEKTGLLIDPYFSATKIKWILDNVEGARDLAEQGQLAFGTVDTFILWHLTQGRSHLTDATNASRTMLYNIHQGCWDEALLALMDIPVSLLPEVCDSAFDFGETNVFGGSIAIQGIAGDQQAALFGQTCFSPGTAKSTYGTGCFLMVNTGEEALKSNNRLLTTIGYQINGQVHYALEGSIFVAGAAIQWLRDGVNMVGSAKETEAIATNTSVDSGIYFVPAFTGLGAPYWDPEARGAIFGLTRATGINEIVSAGLQSVCYQTDDLTQAIAKDGIQIQQMRVDGGMAANNWFIQFLADILNVQIDRPKTVETSALGAAYLAGLQAGVYDSLEHIQSLWQSDTQLTPQMSQSQREKLLHGWQDAVARVLKK